MLKRFSKLACLAALLVTLSACTNSPFAWKLLYGQFDNFLSKQLLSYADFTEAEKDIIRLEVDKTVDWHRQDELPKYAETITEFQSRFLQASQQPGQNDIEWLLDAINDIGLRFDKNSTLLALIPMLSELSDGQVEQISETIDKEFIDSQKEWEKEANQLPEIRAEKSIRKFFKRLGLNTNKSQRRNLIESIKQLQLDREIQQRVWRKWSDQLLKILASRSEAGFGERFTEHHFARTDLLEKSHPEKWKHDQTLYRNMFLELFRSLEEDQKDSMNQKLDKLKQVALELNQSA